MCEVLHDRVRWATAGPIARLTLVRGDAGNALDLDMAEGLREAAHRVAAGREDLAAVLFEAEGRNFCVGGDLRAFATATDQGKYVQRLAESVHEALAVLVASPVPVITVVHGVAAGAGLGLALAGDLVFAGRGARFRTAYTAAGLSPDCGVSWVLPRLLGSARALDLALTNRLLTAEDAERSGLVSRVVDDSVLATEATKTAHLLCEGSSAAMAQAKRLMRTAVDAGLELHLADEARTITRLASTPDGREGVAAFLGKRPPRFGRASGPNTCDGDCKR